MLIYGRANSFRFRLVSWARARQEKLQCVIHDNITLKIVTLEIFCKLIESVWQQMFASKEKTVQMPPFHHNTAHYDPKFTQLCLYRNVIVPQVSFKVLMSI